MVTPNIWGQGQLFAFSALDGTSHIAGDFVGTLSGDKVGIRFHSKVIRELAVVNLQGMDPVFETVASDMILLNTNCGQISIVYADTNTIIGTVPSPAAVIALCEGRHTVTADGCITVQNTGDGEYTALMTQGDRFAFAFGSSEAEVRQKVRKGMQMDADAVIGKKRAFFEKNGLPEDHPYAMLCAKCLSVMKSQLYSPEGRFRRIWSTPDRLPHMNLWLWDSVFHAIGHSNIDPALAEELILAVLDAQQENGFIPHMATPSLTSGITQPPVIGWGAWLVYQRSKNLAFLQRILDGNKMFLLWCRAHRRDTDEELYTWQTKNEERCRCDECGMDNSPRFDRITRLQAIDFSCFMANDTRFMARIAAELGDEENAAFFTNWHDAIKADINRKLWCQEDGFYYDYDLSSKALHKVRSVASFLPIFAGVCSKAQCDSLVACLNDPNAFGSAFAVPSISKQDATYGSDMWRGPVWLNYNYMLIEGLKQYGELELAEKLLENTLAVVNEWYLKTGTVYEFYDPENKKAPPLLNRKGLPFEPYDFTVRYQSIRDYGWTATLTLDMIKKETPCG